jgi:hypothetical protein
MRRRRIFSPSLIRRLDLIVGGTLNVISKAVISKAGAEEATPNLAGVADGDYLEADFIRARRRRPLPALS